MRLNVDANLSPRIAAALREAGHDTTHVVDHGLHTADDETILKHAAAEGRTIVSADSDFATLLALAGLRGPSLVLLRSADRLSPEQQAQLLIANLPTIAAELGDGAVASLSRGHLRLRPLPLR